MIKPEFSEVLRCAESSVYIPEIEHRYKKNDALKKVDPPGKYGQLDIYMLNWLNFREVVWCCCFLFFVRFSYLLNGVDLIFVEVELRR